MAVGPGVGCNPDNPIISANIDAPELPTVAIMLWLVLGILQAGLAVFLTDIWFGVYGFGREKGKE